MHITYNVNLSDPDRDLLEAIISGGGKAGVRRLKRAQILLACDGGVSDKEIARTLPCGTSTIYRTKRCFVEEGLEAALNERPRPGGERMLTGQEEAKLIALACTKSPPGSSHWTMRLLADKVVELIDADTISRETVRRRLAENELKPWQRKMWCIPKVDAEFVARMEDVLDLYAEDPDPLRPVVSFDETPVQLIGETRTPISVQPGQVARIDYEYKRNGTANLFVFVDAHKSWRHVKITDHRTNIDFAECMRDLVDVHYRDAECIRVVMDNLNTHRAKNLYEAFPPDEARRILRRLEFHFTPKHASWLNMVEIEISVLSAQCLDRRIPEREILETEVKAWEERRNQEGARINWMFRVADARRKLRRAYPAYPKKTTQSAAA